MDSTSSAWGRDYKALHWLFSDTSYPLIWFLILPHLLLSPAVISYHRIWKSQKCWYYTMFQKQDSNVPVLKHSWIKERSLWELDPSAFSTSRGSSSSYPTVQGCPETVKWRDMVTNVNHGSDENIFTLIMRYWRWIGVSTCANTFPHDHFKNISGSCIIPRQRGIKSQIGDLKIVFRYKLSRAYGMCIKKKLLRLNFRCQCFIHRKHY